MNVLDFYVTQSERSSPGEFVHLYDALPDTPAALCHVIQGLMIHVLHGNRYGVKLPEERKVLVITADVEQMLRQIQTDDSRPLTEPREPAHRFVGTCRHYALFLTSILRHKGMPARARNGFSTYLKQGVFSDHWVCEVWDEAEQRWRVYDAQMDEPHHEHLIIDFDPTDVPATRQIPAGLMWTRCRNGDEDPQHCGSLKLWGMDYIKGNITRDLAALNKMEMLPWDGAAVAETPYDEMSPEQVHLLDQVAAATAPTVDFTNARNLYDANPPLHAKELPNLHALARQEAQQ